MLSKCDFSTLSDGLLGILANKSGCKVLFLAFSAPPFKILFAKVLNSNSAKISRSFASSGFWISKTSSCSSMGTSVLIVARNFDILISSVAASTFNRILPFSWVVFESRPSTDPNALISFTAVFSPTPGQPGKLSTASPISASKSMTCSGRSTPYFAWICCGPMMS